MSARGGQKLGHFVCEITVDVEDDTIGRPIEAVLVELLVRSEGQVLDLVAVGASCVEAISNGFGRLKDEIGDALRLVELLGEEFHINLLRVVVELFAVSSGL